jgi:hypothetical protein
MTDIELAKALSIARLGQPNWTCHPETRLGPPRQGCKTILVKAAGPPPKGVVKVKFNDDMILLQIVEHQQKHRDLTVMQKAEQIIVKQEKKELGSYAAALGAKPKAKAAANGSRTFTMKDPATNRAYADQNADDQDDAQERNMMLDHLQTSPDDETAGDFSDEEEAPSAPSASAVAKNRFGLPVAVPVKSSIQLRLEQMDRDREAAELRAANDREEHLAAIAAVQEANESAISDLVGRMEKMQATMLAHQEENAAKFREMQTKSQGQFQQMLAFFQKFEASQLKPNHGKGSGKSLAAIEHYMDNHPNGEDEDEEDPHPKKLKVPFNSPCIAGQAAMSAAGC